MSKSKVFLVLKTVGIWTLLVLLAALFTLQGVDKLSPNTVWRQGFERYGYPAGSHLVVGVVELAGGILLLVPLLSGYAALVLATVMIGASGTHVVFGETPPAIATLVLAVIFLLLAYGRRPARVHELRRTRKERWSGATPV